MFTSNSFKLLLLSIFVLLFCFNKSQAQPKAMGEPVPGAEILVEQEPDDVPINRCITDKNGEFTFGLPKGAEVPSSGELTLTVTPVVPGGGIISPAAEILVEQEPNDVPINRCITDKKQNGDDVSLRKRPTTKQKITVKFSTEKGETETYSSSDFQKTYKISKENPIFKFILGWTPPDPIKCQSNRGGFAISGRNTSLLFIRKENALRCV